MIKALIADDEKAVVSIILYFINKEHLPIEVIGTAENGKEALTMIQELHPNLIFLDIQMPIYNGLEVIEKAKDYRYIIITAFDSFNNAQQALRLGAKDIIPKPIERSQLLQAISRAVGWQFTSSTTVNNVLQYIHAHYDEKIDLSHLALMFYATPSHLARSFKKHIGLSVGNYTHRLRIEKAKEMLFNKDYSVKQIAELTGYESLNNFYKYFKQYTGMTPAAFCQENRFMNVENI